MPKGSRSKLRITSYQQRRAAELALVFEANHGTQGEVVHA